MVNMDPSLFKCPWCEVVGKTLRGLSVHVRQHEGKTTQDLYDALYHPTGRPTCKCGCGEAVRFMDIGRGYSEFVHGHAARVSNNWGHNEKAREKSQAKRREMWDNGDLKAWNEGLTKETDDRVSAYGRRGKQTIVSNPSELANRSSKMRKQWIDGSLETIRGPQHSQWKGGLSSIHQLAHSLLYKTWTRPKMVVGSFRCSSCQADRDLCVHHDKDRFSDLLREAAAQVGYDGLLHDSDFEMKSKVAQRLADIHVERDVSGVVLCRECHAQAHEELGEHAEASVIRSRAAG